MRKLFIEKGGKPKRERPYYFLLGDEPDLLKSDASVNKIVINPN